MPPKFHYPDDVDVWRRLQWDMTQHSRSAHFMEAVARLKDGTAIAQAQAATDTLTNRLQSQFPITNKGSGRRIIPLLDEQRGYYRPALMVLFGAVGILLIIGCLNIASPLLTRALSREKEIAVRVAMGASPRQRLPPCGRPCNRKLPACPWARRGPGRNALPSEPLNRACS